jgi:VWFA-related protein
MLNSFREILLRFAMRRLLIFLLLLPLPLVSQVKILMPVVVRDASGKPVTDLKQSDFQVSGPKNISVERMWLVPPQTVSAQNTSVPVTVLYDAADAAYGDLYFTTKWIRYFLGEIAQHRAPVTFYIYTADGLKLIYDPATAPQVLTAALALVETRQGTSNDPQIEEQAKKIELLSTSAQVRTFRFDYVSNQMRSLIALARLLPASEKRKAVIWITTEVAYWDKSLQMQIQEMTCEQFNADHISLYLPIADPVGALARLARSTGGRALTNSGSNTGPLWDVLQATLADFGPYYMLAVAVPTPKETDWIPVKIKVDRLGLTVRAAPGFYGLKPQKTP